MTNRTRQIIVWVVVISMVVALVVSAISIVVS